MAPFFWLRTSAWAACDQAGSTVSCTGTTTNYAPGNLTNTTINVLTGAIVQGASGSNAINVNVATAVTLNNYGTIDGRVVFIGTADFTNYGILRMTDPTTAGTGLSHSIPGTFEQAASGSLFSRFDATGANNDGLFAADAKLNGKFIAVIQPGLYTNPIDYFGVINTTSGITGAFASVTASSPFFSASLTPSGNNLDLTITRIPFNAVSGQTPNQRAVGNVLETAYATTPTGDAETLFSNLFAATSIGVLDQLSGAGTSAAQDAAFTAGGLFGSTMLQQGLSWLNGAPSSNGVTFGGLGYAAPPAGKLDGKSGRDAFAAMPRADIGPGRWRAWGLGFGATHAIDGQAGTAGQTSQAFGGSFGADRQVAADWLLGFAVGGSGTHFFTDSLSTSGHADAAHLGVYAVHTFDSFYVAATLNYARADTATERTITGVGPTETAKGRFASDQLGGRLELGWKHAIQGLTLTPFAAIEPAALWQHAYTESSTTAGGGAGVLGLSYQSNTVTSLPTSLGVQFDARYEIDNGKVVSPYVRASWVHEFKPERSIQASFVTIPGMSFTADGARAAPDAARIEAGATLALSRGVALFGSVNSELSDRSRSFAGLGSVRVSW